MPDQISPRLRSLPRRVPTRPGNRNAGFTLVEVAMVLLLIGLIAAISTGVFSSALGSREVRTATAIGAEAEGAILAFARTHNRLPCPDTNGDGREGNAAGTCPAGVEMGWVPYESLGMQRPATASRAVYGVHRDVVANTDLVAPAIGVPSRSDFIHALARGAALTTAVSSHVYLTGDNGAHGAEDCAGNLVLNPAFAVVVPASDRDGDGNNLDGINAVLPAVGSCLAAPGRAPGNTFDDRVTATGFAALLGAISTNAP